MFGPDSVLVIVDMQPAFAAAKCEKTTQNIIKLIKRAKKRWAKIVVLEYDMHGPTRKDIMKEVRKYKYATTMTKFDDDGHAEVIAAVPSPKRIILCGVNFGACVLKTAKGLWENGFKKIKIVRSACNNPDYFMDWEVYEERYIEYFGPKCLMD